MLPDSVLLSDSPQGSYNLVLSNSLVLSDGLVLFNSLVLSNSMVIFNSLVISESLVLSDGLVRVQETKNWILAKIIPSKPALKDSESEKI